MSRNRKILLAAACAVLGLLACLVVLPFFFVDQIEARIRAEIARATRVEVAWDDVGLTFFRDFPHPTLSLRGLTVVGTGRFEGDTLASVADFRLALEGPSAVRAVRGTGPLVVRSVEIGTPTVRLAVGDDGIRNWDVLPAAEGDASRDPGRSIAIALRAFEITDGDISFDDTRSSSYVALRGLRHSLEGDFSRESVAAHTRMHADALTVRFAGAPYLSDVSLDVDAGLEVDLAQGRVRFADNEVSLNDLMVRLDGTVAREGDNVVMDLTFAAPGTDFGQALSLLPAVYANDFASLRTAGTFALEGRMQGAYGPAAFPSFALRLNVAGGSFRYPDRDLPAEAISAELAITNPGGHLDSTVVNLARFHVEIDGQPLDASFTLRRPVSDPEVDARVEGTLDLGDVARTMKLENAEGLGGVLAADARVQARRSDVDSARYDRIIAAGTVSATDVTLRSETLRQPVTVREARLQLSPQTAELRAFDARLGSSDLQATGRLDNVLGFALGQQPLLGTARFTSGHFNLDEWKSDDEVASIAVPSILDLTLDGTIDRLVVNGLETTNARGRAIVRNQRLTLEGFSLEALGGRIGLDGYYETLDPARPEFSLDLVMDSLDVAGTAAAFATVRALAPVARYARGTFSTALNVNGALGQDLAPALDALNGLGSLSTSRLAIEGFPMFERLAETLRLERLSHPTVDALRSSIRIQNGRLIVDPFTAGVGGLGMTVSGSNGIDQSLDYTLVLQVPRAGLVDATLTSLASRAGPLGTRLAAADPVRVSTRVTGSVTQPALDVGLTEATGSLRDAATRSAESAVGQRLDDAQQRLDASREEARLRASAQADSIVADARRQADIIRAEAARLAAEVRSEGNRAADEVLARASNPLARTAAGPVAERLRREADERATTIEREADERANALVASAEERAATIRGGDPGPG